MNFKTRYLFSSLLCFFALIALLITCVDTIAMNRRFYTAQYDKLNTAEHIGMSDIGLYEATDTLLDYMQDYRDDVYVEVEINGVERAVFDTRETMHMVDVKNLYLSVILVRNVLIVFCVILFALLAYDRKNELMSILTYAYKRVFVMFAFLVGGIITYAACDFSTFWTYFHKVFFTNDLWLLDPRVSVMINMFPLEFFYAMVFTIVLSFVGISIGVWFYSLFDQKQRMKSLSQVKGTK